LNILVDEDYNDWNEISPVYTDPGNDQISGNIDFGRLWISNNSNFLFLRIEVGDKLNFQDNNLISLFIDSDNNAETGLSISNIGAELEYIFGERRGNVRLGSDTYEIYHNDIGLITSPTVTSEQFEIAIDLNTEISGKKLFQADSISILFLDNSAGSDQLPDTGERINFQLSRGNNFDLPGYSINKENPEFLRVLSYNVLRDNLFETGLFDEYSRILKAVNADIFAFQEIYDNTSRTTAELIEEILPSEEGQYWYHSKAEDLVPSNPYNTDLVIVSRFKIKESFRIEGFYIEGSVVDRANFAVLLDLRPKYDSDLLVVNAHPPCCSRDDRRQEEVDKIMAFIRDAKSEGGELTLAENTPILVVGDMNFVGLDSQRNTLLTGNIQNNNAYGPDFNPDWNGSDFADAKPYTTDIPGNFTWYNEGESFPPGRLDYIIYSSTAMTIKNSFSLFTPAMEPDSLLKYGLQENDVVSASDHLPLVADFELDPATSIKRETGNVTPEDIKLFQNYPNPFNPATKIMYTIPQINYSPRSGNNQRNENPNNDAVPVKLTVYDNLGRKLKTLINEHQSPGINEVNFNSSDLGFKLSSGIYYYRLSVDDFHLTKKMILLK
jgi:endonuclease/exonuclease/phosphatase family metal-dependent hydrolase